MIDEEAKKKLLEELENGTKHALICSSTVPPKWTPWEHVKDSCGLCGCDLWRDARNTEAMKSGNMVAICIPCALPHIGPKSMASSLVAGRMMTVQKGFEAVVKYRGTPPEEEPDA